MTSPVEHATEKQIAYIRDLGGSISNGITKKEASAEIKRLQASKPKAKSIAIEPKIVKAEPATIKENFIGFAIISIIIIFCMYLLTRCDNKAPIVLSTIKPDETSIGYLKHSGVIITSGGKCYHLSEDCVSLRDEYTSIDWKPVDMARARGLRLCQICMRNFSPNFMIVPKYRSNNYANAVLILTNYSSYISQSNHVRGPGNLDEFSPTTTIYRLLWTGFNVECDENWDFVDTWGPDGIHYNCEGWKTSNYFIRQSAWKWIDSRKTF